MEDAVKLKEALEKQIRADEELKKLLLQKKRISEVLLQELQRQKGKDETLQRTLEQEEITNKQLQADYNLLTTGTVSLEQVQKIKQDLIQAEQQKNVVAGQLANDLELLKGMQTRLNAGATVINQLSQQTEKAITEHSVLQEQIATSPKFSAMSFVVALAAVFGGVFLYELSGSNLDVGLAYGKILETTSTGTSFFYFIGFLLVAAIFTAIIMHQQKKRAHKKTK